MFCWVALPPTNSSVRPVPSPHPANLHVANPSTPASHWLGPKNRGRGSAWLLTVGILSNKEWGDLRAAQGRPLCRAAGGGHPEFCCRKRHQLGRTAQQRSGVSSESKGACLQTVLLMKAKLLPPPTRNVTPFTSAQCRRQFPDPDSAHRECGWRAPRVPALLPNADSWAPKTRTRSLEAGPGHRMLPGGPDVLQCVRPIPHGNWEWVSLLPVPLGARASLGSAEEPVQVLCSGSRGLCRPPGDAWPRLGSRPGTARSSSVETTGRAVGRGLTLPSWGAGSSVSFWNWPTP